MVKRIVEPKYYFSTPMINPHCPFGLKNLCLLVSDIATWDRQDSLLEDEDLSRWMRSRGFGELFSNHYQADNPELMNPQTIIEFLKSHQMIHNTGMDAMLAEIFEEDV